MCVNVCVTCRSLNMSTSHPDGHKTMLNWHFLCYSLHRSIRLLYLHKQPSTHLINSIIIYKGLALTICQASPPSKGAHVLSAQHTTLVPCPKNVTRNQNLNEKEAECQDRCILSITNDSLSQSSHRLPFPQEQPPRSTAHKQNTDL